VTTSLRAETTRCPTCGQSIRKRRSGGIKRSSADIKFSKRIRERDRYTCQRCGAVHAENSTGLHSAHMFSRRILATRFDPENAVAACYGCHQYLDSHPNEKLAFFRERLGEERFDALEARAKGKRNR
jgi:5-methylcytosine-specific restriction endonuclease McrA